MKNILISHTNYSKFGGEDANYQEEVAFLEKYFRVKQLTFFNSEKLKFSDILSFFFNSNYVSNKKFKTLIENNKIDTFYVHNLWFKGNLGLLKLAYKNNLEIIIKIHNFRYSCAKSYSSNKHSAPGQICNACNFSGRGKFRFNKYYSESIIKSLFIIWHTKKLIKLLKTYPVKIIALNNLHKNYLEETGIDSNKIYKFYNPISIPKNLSNVYDSENTNVVYIGRITEEKGIFDLIKNWKKFDNKNVVLKIAGQIENEQIYNLLKSAPDIEYLGELNLNESLKIISRSRSLILPTKIFEGQPRVLCEASSMGVPSIFPSWESLCEFFPDEYELAYRYDNQNDFQTKLSIIHDTKKLRKISKEVLEFTNKKLSEKTLINDFQKIIQGY